MPITIVQLGQALRRARLRRNPTPEEVVRGPDVGVSSLSEPGCGEVGAPLENLTRVAPIVAPGLERDADEPQVELDRFPALRLLAWSMPGRRTIGERDALALYEANWRFVDQDELLPVEIELIQHLLSRHGGGVLNV